MTHLTDYTSFSDAQSHCSTETLWALFDGDRQSFNIAYECVDRHASEGKVAIVVAYANGSEEVITFKALSRLSNRFANLLVARGVQPGDRVAVMLEPSLAFYVAIFGAIKTGAIAVPLFTLFGPDGIRLRVEDCKPKILVTNAEKAPVSARHRRCRGARGRWRLRAEPECVPRHLRGPDNGRGLRDIPVHVRHHPRTAGGRQAQAARTRHADAGGALRHRRPAR